AGYHYSHTISAPSRGNAMARSVQTALQEGSRMTLIKLWLEYLTRMQVRYSHSVHPRAQTARETANAERVPAHEFAKTVVYYGDNGFGIAVVPADEFVNLARVARNLGLACIRLANEVELAELFPDCELGAMPPFGDACEMPVIVDPTIA